MNNNTKPFLATTAIEDFWETSRHVIFLGNWCKRYSRREYWQNLDSETLPSYFNEEEKHRVYLYLNSVFERLLPVLSKQMNQIHGADFSVKYWRIILGAWLVNYIHVIYDRYNSLKHFLTFHPDFTSVCLDEECFVTPKDTIHFFCHIRNDDYNLQVYSRILSALGYKLPTKKLPVFVPDVNMYFFGKNELIKNILKYFYEALNKTFFNKNQVFLRSTFFTHSNLMELFLKTKGAVRSCIYGYEDLPDFSVDYPARASLKKCDFGENDFERILMELIPLEMPKNMIEGLSFLRKKVENKFIPAPKAIMSSISWWFENVFQAWAADAAEKGTLLLGVQHGGNYGIAEDFFQEDLELSIVDIYYSWGWNQNHAGAKVVPMPAPKLVKSKKKYTGKSAEILYVLTSYPRYLYQFPWSTDYWENYFSNQVLFLSRLSEEVMARLRVRPHREDFGWDIKERLKDSFPELRIENWDIPFSESLNDCSLYICDHPLQSTTFIESLVSNKPTVLFYNPAFAANAVRPEAADLFGKLEKSAILFGDPVSAARHLNAVYASIGNWWNEPERQKVVKRFLGVYGKTSSTWLAEWSAEILNLSNNRIN